MSLTPSPSTTRGTVTLQPAYFTSSCFVHAARADINDLVCAYARQYVPSAPFALFKDIWHRQGWTWIQFKVFDARSRAAFLSVMMRLFLERIGVGEPPLTRVVALFGMYTMYSTQPSLAPSLHTAAQVEVTCDVYQGIRMLPDALGGAHLLPIRPHVIYVQSSLLRAQVFHVLPHGETRPQSALPREVLGEDMGVRTRRGRPCRRERARRARACLAALEGGEGVSRPSGEAYATAKGALVDAVDGDAQWAGAMAEASGAVSARIKYFCVS